MSYRTIIEELWRNGRPPGHHDLSISYAVDVVEHEDFDIPGVMAVSPTGRVMLIVEGDKELVGPIIEAAIAAQEKTSAKAAS